jgi:hypothetical protein
MKNSLSSPITGTDDPHPKPEKNEKKLGEK